MKKIFAKELAALAVLALAFTGCNTAFDGTNANFSEKESVYTDRSGATQTENNPGSINVSGTLDVTKKNNEISVTIGSFSKINISSANDAITFQRLDNNSKNTATATYVAQRGAAITKGEPIHVVESATGATITYKIDGTGIAENYVAVFVDATKLKTKGGTPVLATDPNLKRGEETDSVVKYLAVTGFTTTPKQIIGRQEDFAPTYSPVGYSSASIRALYDSDEATRKLNGKYRVVFAAANKNYNHPESSTTADYESGLKDKLDVVIQYREPGSRSYKEEKVNFTYNESSTTSQYSNPIGAHTYTADVGPFKTGTYYRLIVKEADGYTAPDWYVDAYGHKAFTYTSTTRPGTINAYHSGVETLHTTLPTYIVSTTGITAGTDSSSSYVPNSYDYNTIKTAQDAILDVSYPNYYAKVVAATGYALDPANCKDFILVDSNNKKVDAEVTVFLNDDGKVNYVKILPKSVQYRSSLSGLRVFVGTGTKITENKTYPTQVTFGKWTDVIDDDISGYVQIN
jgi:hypothetical protein